MNAIHTGVSEPIITECYLRHSDGRHVTVDIPYRGDHFNLSTGECRVARIIGGIRYDTSRATLIAGTGMLDEDTGAYWLKRLYRATHGAYFELRMVWPDEFGFEDTNFIRPMSEDRVLNFARTLVLPHDCMRFLLNWYWTGWIPRNDVLAQAWAERVLSDDDCEWLLSEMPRCAQSLLHVEDDW